MVIGKFMNETQSTLPEQPKLEYNERILLIGFNKNGEPIAQKARVVGHPAKNGTTPDHCELVTINSDDEIHCPAGEKTEHKNNKNFHTNDPHIIRKSEQELFDRPDIIAKRFGGVYHRSVINKICQAIINTTFEESADDVLQNSNPYNQ